MKYSAFSNEIPNDINRVRIGKMIAIFITLGLSQEFGMKKIKLIFIISYYFVVIYVTYRFLGIELITTQWKWYKGK